VAFSVLLDKPAEETATLATAPVPDQAIAPPPGDEEVAQFESGPPRDEFSGPQRARIEKEQRDGEMSERARLWAELRHRERQSEPAPVRQHKKKEKKEKEKSESFSIDVGLLLRRMVIVVGVAAVLALIAGGAYFLFFGERDLRLNALETWEEFSKDTAAANQKYKGKFILLTGKVKIFTAGKSNRYFFEAPESSKWGIEISLPAKDLKELKADQEITVRCRFGTRKEPDGNLVLSNCTLLK
jgi:hypothetical protein